MKAGTFYRLLTLVAGLMLVMTPCAQAASKSRVLVQKKNPITGKLEWVPADSTIVGRTVGTIISPVRSVTKTLFGSDFQQVGDVPGFGGKLTQKQIETPTGYKRNVEKIATGTAGWAGKATGSKTLELKASRAARDGVRKVLNTETGSSSGRSSSGSNVLDTTR